MEQVVGSAESLQIDESNKAKDMRPEIIKYTEFVAYKRLEWFYGLSEEDRNKLAEERKRYSDPKFKKQQLDNFNDAWKTIDNDEDNQLNQLEFRDFLKVLCDRSSCPSMIYPENPNERINMATWKAFDLINPKSKGVVTKSDFFFATQGISMHMQRFQEEIKEKMDELSEVDKLEDEKVSAQREAALSEICNRVSIVFGN